LSYSPPHPHPVLSFPPRRSSDLNFAWDYVGVSFPVDSKLQELKDSESEVATLRKKNDDAERIRGSEDKFVDDFARLLLISEETRSEERRVGKEGRAQSAPRP